jgi:dynein heavy chain
MCQSLLRLLTSFFSSPEGFALLIPLVVDKDEVVCKAQAAEANAIKLSCEQGLAKALPALDGAVKALKSLSKGDIGEVKAMQKPPPGVKLTMEATCMMFAVKPEKVKDPESGKKVDDYWGPAKAKLLGDPKFLDNLMNYDKDNMDPDMVVKVGKFCERDDFTPEAITKASVAAAGICKWVHAMIVYDEISKDIAPKKAALKAASDALNSPTAMLAEKQAVLKELLDKLAVLNAGLKEAMDKKTALGKQVGDCSKKLVRAEQLISGLGGERDRWRDFSAKLAEKYENVTGDIMLSAGVVAYLGSFVSSYREEALAKWAAALRASGIACSSPFSLRDTLGDEVAVRNWVIAKLPNDSVSIENAIMLQRSNRWPLMIDPQGQANRWVKMLEGGNAELPLKVVKQSMPNFRGRGAGRDGRVPRRLDDGEGFEGERDGGEHGEGDDRQHREPWLGQWVGASEDRASESSGQEGTLSCKTTQAPSPDSQAQALTHRLVAVRFSPMDLLMSPLERMARDADATLDSMAVEKASQEKESSLSEARPTPPITGISER